MPKQQSEPKSPTQEPKPSSVGQSNVQPPSEADDSKIRLRLRLWFDAHKGLAKYADKVIEAVIEAGIDEMDDLPYVTAEDLKDIGDPDYVKEFMAEVVLWKQGQLAMAAAAGASGYEFKLVRN